MPHWYIGSAMKSFYLAALASVTVTLAAGNVAAQTPSQPPPSQPPSSPPPAGQVQVVPAPLAPAAAAPQNPALSAPPGAGGTVRIHLRALRDKDTARLYIRAADGFTLVCAAPCTADIPQNSELRTTLNNNDEEPHTFTVPSDAGPEVDLEVKPASLAPVIGGIILMGSGGVFVLTGLLFVALGDVTDSNSDGISSSSYSSSSYQKSQSDELKTTGYVCIVLGAAAAVGGLIWLTTRSHEPRINEAPHRSHQRAVYGRAETVFGDMALAKPRDPTTAIGPAVTPFSYSFSF